MEISMKQQIVGAVLTLSVAWIILEALNIIDLI